MGEKADEIDPKDRIDDLVWAIFDLCDEAFADITHEELIAVALGIASGVMREADIGVSASVMLMARKGDDDAAETAGAISAIAEYVSESIEIEEVPLQ